MLPDNWTKIISRNGTDHLVYRPAAGGTIEVFDILVESTRGVGTGTSMLNELIETEQPTRITAVTRETNTLANKFWRKNGFVGYMMPDFYPDGHAVMYIKCV